MQKGNALTGLVIAVIAIAVIGAWLFYAQNRNTSASDNPNGVGQTGPSETKDWTLHQSEHLPYVMFVPPETKIQADAWQLDEKQENTTFRLNHYLKLPKSVLDAFGQPEDRSFLFVAISARPIESSHFSIHEWVNQNIEEVHGGDMPTSWRDTTLAGESAYYAEYIFHLSEFTQEAVALISYKYYLFHDGYLYTISGVKVPEIPAPTLVNHPYYPYLKAAEPVAEKIIQSFRFTK